MEDGIRRLIKKIRTEKGISIRELSRRSGVSHPYLSQIETGHTANLTVEKLNKITKALNVPIHEFLKEVSELPPPKEHYTLGGYLRVIRKEKRITLVELSEITEVSQPFLSQIENDKNTPSPQTLRKIATGLGVDYLKLMVKIGYLTEEELTK